MLVKISIISPIYRGENNLNDLKPPPRWNTSKSQPAVSGKWRMVVSACVSAIPIGMYKPLLAWCPSPSVPTNRTVCNISPRKNGPCERLRIIAFVELRDSSESIQTFAQKIKLHSAIPKLGIWFIIVLSLFLCCHKFRHMIFYPCFLKKGTSCFSSFGFVLPSNGKCRYWWRGSHVLCQTTPSKAAQRHGRIREIPGSQNGNSKS